MLSGFNTNFRYRGVLFHVQTEDSGRDNPHVITHLFHGGNIMSSFKRDYSMLLDEDDVETAVRKMMENQHKSMLKQLSRGEHDAVIAQRLGPEVFRVEPESAAAPPSVTEEEWPPVVDEGVDAADAADDFHAAPFVVAEHASLGDAGGSSNAVGSDAILEPKFEDDSTGTSNPSAPAVSTRIAPPKPPEGEPDAPRKTNELSRMFGERVVSEKPLDEVVMDYLVENARKRKRQPE